MKNSRPYIISYGSLKLETNISIMCEEDILDTIDIISQLSRE